MILYAKSVVQFLGGIITNSVYTQHTQTRWDLCFNLLPVQYTGLTHQKKLNITIYIRLKTQFCRKLHICVSGWKAIEVIFAESEDL